MIYRYCFHCESCAVKNCIQDSMLSESMDENDDDLIGCRLAARPTRIMADAEMWEMS